MYSFPADAGENSIESEKDLLSIGEECEEWPVQKVEAQTLILLAILSCFTVHSAKEGGEEGEPGYLLQVKNC